MTPIRPVGIRQDETAVSNVLGAILVFGLFVVTLVSIQTEFAPVWQKQRESDLMQDVLRQMGTLKSGLDRQVGNQTNVPVSHTLPLQGTQGFAILQEDSLPGTLAFLPSAPGTGVTLTSPQLTMLSADGLNLYGLAEQWTTITGGTIAGVTRIAHLRLRLVDPACVSNNNCNDPAIAALTMTDANGKCAGRIVIVDSVAGSDRTVEAQIYGPRSPPAGTCPDTPLTIQDTDAKKQTNPPYYYLDAFDPEFQFRAVLAAATYPVSITMTTSGGIAADYTIVYDSVSGGSSQGGAGPVIPNYSSLTPSGSLTLQKMNQRYPSQTYTLEHGAIIIDQADGCGMVVPPSFSVSTSSTQTRVGWSIPGMTGSPNRMTGADAATVISFPGARRIVEALAPQLTFTLRTDHPYQWATFWDQELKQAGLTGNTAIAGTSCDPGTTNCSAGLQYSICMTPTTATLTLYGPTSSPSSTLNDLHLTFQAEPLTIELQATG